jgi:geranylgeranyl pyrophosphate synthase
VGNAFVRQSLSRQQKLSVSDLKSVLPAAVAGELVQNFTLFHDDIMDKDDSRRGMPAVHD